MKIGSGTHSASYFQE